VGSGEVGEELELRHGQEENGERRMDGGEHSC
jgi:hypothetical protein